MKQNIKILFYLSFVLYQNLRPWKSNFCIFTDNKTKGERGKHFALLSKQYPNIEMNNHILLIAYVRQSSDVGRHGGRGTGRVGLSSPVFSQVPNWELTRLGNWTLTKEMLITTTYLTVKNVTSGQKNFDAIFWKSVQKYSGRKSFYIQKITGSNPTFCTWRSLLMLSNVMNFEFLDDLLNVIDWIEKDSLSNDSRKVFEISVLKWPRLPKLTLREDRWSWFAVVNGKLLPNHAALLWKCEFG